MAWIPLDIPERENTDLSTGKKPITSVRLPVGQTSCSGITLLLLGLTPSALLLFPWETPTANWVTPPEPLLLARELCWGTRPASVLINSPQAVRAGGLPTGNACQRVLAPGLGQAAWGGAGGLLACFQGGCGTTDTHTTFQSLGTSQGAIGKHT